jgi:DNA-binding response OmpR family regulator
LYWIMSKLRVLVVENEMPTVMMVVSLLTQAGFSVEATTKGHKGLEIAWERRFDLIILERGLPDLDGFKICADLKQRHISYRTPIVFLSSQPEEEYEARELGAADFIKKPFGADDFVSRIQSVLEETTSA